MIDVGMMKMKDIDVVSRTEYQLNHGVLGVASRFLIHNIFSHRKDALDPNRPTIFNYLANNYNYWKQIFFPLISYGDKARLGLFISLLFRKFAF